MPIMTVCGEIADGELGITLPHEHLFLDLTNQFGEPSTPEARELGRQNVGEPNLAALRRNPYAVKDNLLLDDMELAVEEVDRFKQAGGQSIVDCTSIGIRRDPGKLRELSLRTGVNIIAGSGYYTQDTHPADLQQWSEREAASHIVRDLTEGIDGTGIRAGIIGEIGVSDPVHPDEEKVLRAAAIAFAETGAGIQVHTYPWGHTGLKAADILIRRNVDPAKIVVCHTDVAIDPDYMRALLDRGVSVEFDDFGKEFDLEAGEADFAAGGFASDAERITAIKDLTAQGYGKQLLITTDVCLKCLLHKFGGHGYDHILVNVAPALREAGLAEETIDGFLRQNPKRLLRR